MKKVLLIAPISTTNWGSVNAGGVDSVAQSLVQAIQAKGESDFFYRVAAIDPYSEHRYTATPEQLSPYLEVVHIPANEYCAKIRIPGIISQAFRIRQEVSRFRPDIVHAHNLNWLIGVSNKKLRVATAHAYKAIGRNSVSMLNDVLYEKILPPISGRFIDAFTCVGKSLQSVLSKDYKKIVQIIENPINADYFSRTNIHIKKSEHISIVTCAIITRRKRLEYGIQLIKDLIERGHSAKLTIIGKIGDKQFYDELVDLGCALGISDRINFTGHLSRKEIIDHYLSASLGLYTSKDETFGLAPLEMLATGLPLYTTCVGIIESRKNDFFHHGVKFWSDDAGERVAAVLNLLNRPFNENCRNWMQSQFSAASVVEKYEALYGDPVLNKK